MLQEFKSQSQVEDVLKSQNHILEMIATGCPFSEVLENIIKTAELQIANTRCSILILDKTGKTLHKGSAPSLPKDYCAAMDGFEIGPMVGACGTAAFKNETVIVEDIAIDPLWQEFKDLALPHNLRACWSTPIQNTDGKVLGTFCPYFNEPRGPTDQEIQLVKSLAHLAGILIQREQTECVVVESEERYRKIFHQMRSVLEGISSEVGNEFIKALVSNLALALNVRYAFLGECLSIEPVVIRTLAFWGKNEFIHVEDYSVINTPCNNVLKNRRMELFPEDIQKVFPTNMALKSNNVQSYMGVPLFDESKNKIGILAVMDDRPMHEVENAKTILSVFALRAEAELIHKKTEENLMTAKIEADRANNAKSEFLSRMSHELRTPLNAIIGFSQLLVRDTKNPLNDIQREDLVTITNAGTHLLELINEILDLSKVESGKLEITLKEVLLKPVINEVINLVQPLSKQKAIEIEIAEYENLSLVADFIRLKQVLFNLLSNAIKYNKDNGSVSIDVLKDEEFVTIKVSDNGRGIPTNKHNRLFEPFDRLDIDTASIEGAGIGLTISNHLVKLMNGKLEFESVEGEGTTFFVRLPLEKN
jgi:signal transduction histidine kinase